MTEIHLWTNGRVFTGLRYTDALLVEGDRVVAAGTERELRSRTPTGTEVHNLEGHLLLPGLIDAHLHLVPLARSRDSFDARGIGSFDLLIEQLREWAGAHPSGALVGGGWEAEQFREGRDPDRTVLDRAVDDRPVVLYHVSLHLAAVNGAALSVAHVDRSTPDPAHGTFGRDPDGAPNGLLYEEAARSVGRIAQDAFPPDPAGMVRTLQGLATLGLTTVVSVGAGREENALLRDLSGDGRSPVRVRTYVSPSALDAMGAGDLRSRERADQFATLGVKTFADGAFGPRTAWLREPYADAPDRAGSPAATEDELSVVVEGAARRGFAPAVHAIGDRAIEAALRVVAPWVGRTRAPVRIEHAALTPPSLLPAIDRVRPALVVQPGFVWSDHWLRARLGSARARWAYAFRTLIDRGHLLAGSSDAPVDPVDPWRGLAACLLRRDPLGRSANPETGEALPAEESVLLYTRNGGRVLGEPDLGTLEAGARADLLVTDSVDLPRVIARGSTGIVETWTGGRRVYGRALSPPPATV